MATKEYEAAKAILDNILVSYKPVSQAAPEPTDRNWYKAINQDGSIWLVANPSAWRESLDEQGRTIRHRPQPEKKLTLAEARAEADANKGKLFIQKDTPARGDIGL